MANKRTNQYILLEHALKFATIAHAGQVDEGDEPYILHPIRVMQRLRTAGADIDTQIVGLLHDVIEDTTFKDEYIRLEFGSLITDAVLSVTRKEGEIYRDFIKRAFVNPIGCLVKLADIDDNSDSSRKGHTEFVQKHPGIMNKYYIAKLYLRGMNPNY